MNRYKIILFLIIVFCFLVLGAKVKKSQYPKEVEDLIIPSGFDNSYAFSVREGKSFRYAKPYLRVIEFEVTDSFLKAIKEANFKFDDILKAEIANTGRFQLLANEADIEAVFMEQKKIGQDEFDPKDKALEIGKLKIASYVLRGGVTHSYPIIKQQGGHFSLKVSVSVSITVLNATTGAVEFTSNISSEKEELLFVTSDGLIVRGPRNLTNKSINSIRATGLDVDLSPQYYAALYDSVKKIMKLLEEKYPIVGEVLEVKNSFIYSTASIEQGLKKGDYIVVVRTGKPLVSSSGEILGLDKEAIAAAEILTVEKGMSIGRIIKLKDKNIKIKKGDLVISLPQY